MSYQPKNFRTIYFSIYHHNHNHQHYFIADIVNVMSFNCKKNKIILDKNYNYTLITIKNSIKISYFVITMFAGVINEQQFVIITFTPFSFVIISK